MIMLIYLYIVGVWSMTSVDFIRNLLDYRIMKINNIYYFMDEFATSIRSTGEGHILLEPLYLRTAGFITNIIVTSEKSILSFFLKNVMLSDNKDDCMESNAFDAETMEFRKITNVNCSDSNVLTFNDTSIEGIYNVIKNYKWIVYSSLDIDTVVMSYYKSDSIKYIKDRYIDTELNIPVTTAQYLAQMYKNKYQYRSVHLFEYQNLYRYIVKENISPNIQPTVITIIGNKLFRRSLSYYAFDYNVMNIKNVITGEDLESELIILTSTTMLKLRSDTFNFFFKFNSQCYSLGRGLKYSDKTRTITLSQFNGSCSIVDTDNQFLADFTADSSGAYTMLFYDFYPLLLPFETLPTNFFLYNLTSRLGEATLSFTGINVKYMINEPEKKYIFTDLIGSLATLEFNNLLKMSEFYGEAYGNKIPLTIESEGSNYMEIPNALRYVVIAIGSVLVVIVFVIMIYEIRKRYNTEN